MGNTDLLDRLRARDWRMTPQRRTIAQVLVESRGHLTADELLEGAKDRLPEVSLTTVYNTLHELVSMGEVCEIRSLGGSARYDANISEHHHVRCVDCGEVEDVHPEGLEALRLSDGERQGYTLVGVEIIFEGRCPDCA